MNKKEEEDKKAAIEKANVKADDVSKEDEKTSRVVNDEKVQNIMDACRTLPRAR